MIFMGKKATSNYMKVSRRIFNKYKRMSPDCKYLYVVLCELEQKYCNENDWFMRCDEELAGDCGWGVTKLRKVKKELKEYPELVRIWRGNWHYTRTNKSSIRQPTCYEIWH